MNNNCILVVDDLEINRSLLSDILDDYDVIEAADGNEAVKKVEENIGKISAVLLDLVMPEMDGFHVLSILKEKNLLDRFPVIIITGDDSKGSEKKCYELGAYDFIRKPFDRMLVRLRVANAVQLYGYKNSLEEKVNTQTKQLQMQYKLLQDSAEKLRKSNQKIIEILGAIVEYRNLESGEHVKRVMGYTEILAKTIMEDYPEYNLTPKMIETITAASALHDIGKITIPDSILFKPAKLTDDEFEYMKSHTLRGCDILKSIEGAWDADYGKYSYEICRYHHERFNGKGYPEKLVGDDIPIAAQIVSVADVYDALVNERCYKEAYSKEDAFIMIVQGECGVFNPKMMQAFRKCRGQFEELADRNSGNKV